MPNIMHVRVKPSNKPAGHVRKTVHVSGVRFVHGEWQDFDLDKPGIEGFLAYLRTERQNVVDPESPEAFDICTPAEAREIRNRERYGHLNEAISTPAKLQPPESVESEQGMSEMNKEDPVHRLDLPPPAPPVEPVAPPPPPAPVAPPATAPIATPTPPPMAPPPAPAPKKPTASRPKRKASQPKNKRR